MKYVFHLLKPIKEFEPNWWTLKWKPIKNGTWNLYVFKNLSSILSLKIHKSNAHNGWGRSWDGFAIDLDFFKYSIHFWIHYNLKCMKDGALDQNPSHPLNFDL